MSVKNRHRKICGYLGCFIILGTLLETEIPTIRNHSTIEHVRTERVQLKNKNSIDDHNTSFIHSDTDRLDKIYFINNQPVDIDTSKQGWVVELMYAQKKKNKE